MLGCVTSLVFGCMMRVPPFVVILILSIWESWFRCVLLLGSEVVRLFLGLLAVSLSVYFACAGVYALSKFCV